MNPKQWAENPVWKRKRNLPSSRYLLLNGKKVRFDGPVLAYDEPDGLSFYRARAAQGAKPGAPSLFSPRGKQHKIQMLLLHADDEYTSSEGFSALVKRESSTHLLLDFDGTLHQALDFKENAWHQGAANVISIGLHLNNALPDEDDYLYSPELVKRYPRQAGALYRRPIVEGTINGVRMREFGYTAAQYETLIVLIRWLHRHLGLDLRPPVLRNGTVARDTLLKWLSFRGWAGHFHVEESHGDPGPGFDWALMLHRLFGRRLACSWPLAGGKPLSQLYGASLSRLAERFYRNNERSKRGGYYPVGLHFNWHNGIHLHVEEGRAVKAILDGTVVAARNTSRTLLGDPNFVLLRHQIDLSATERLNVFTLYMHMQSTDLRESGLRWFSRADSQGRVGVIPPSANDLAVPRVGNGLSALLAGDIALFPIGGPGSVRVGAGEKIGTVGRFNGASLLHLELFSRDQPIDFDQSPEWIELSPSTSRSLRIREPTLVELFGRETPGEPTPSSKTIRSFYSRPGNRERIQLRLAICQHMSEWSQDVSWIDEIVAIQPWDRWLAAKTDHSGIFSGEIAKLLPFLWLDGRVSAHLDLHSPGIITTLHPIRFLVWLKTRYERFEALRRNLRVQPPHRILYERKRLRAKKRALGKEPKLKIPDGCPLWLPVDAPPLQTGVDLYDIYGDLLEETENGEWPIEFIDNEFLD